jgi:XTP/dITP diphosphohydrolase
LELLFATGNQGKIAEAEKVLKPLGIEVIRYPIDLHEPTAGTVKDIAIHKLQQVIVKGVDHVMVDDAGIYFAAYPQFPGILSKRVFQGIGYRGIGKLLQGESRVAWFEGAIALCWKGQVQVFTGVTKGRLIEKIDDSIEVDPHFPYDPLFIPEGEKEVLKFLPQDKRLYYSYRRRALEQMAHWLFKQN